MLFSDFAVLRESYLYLLLYARQRKNIFAVHMNEDDYFAIKTLKSFAEGVAVLKCTCWI